MATLRDYFLSEVAEHLERFNEALSADPPDAEALHRAARGIRGAAQMAREDAALRAARTLENATRALRTGAFPLDSDGIGRLRATAEDLRAIGDGADADGSADAIAARWSGAGIDAVPPVTQQPAGQETRAFLEYAAHEVAGIAGELDRSIASLSADALEREPLKAVLRRQRGLLGSARLGDIPVLAEALRAVEDMTSIIGKLNVAVRHEWLDVFRCARDVLVSAVPLLETGHQPEVTTSLRRLRVLRHELLERHGIGGSVSTAHGDAGLSQPQMQDELVLQEVVQQADARHQPTTAAAASGPQPAAADSIDVRDLQYRGERALQRAAELRPVLERMLADTQGGREALAELYDLLRLAQE